LKNTTLNIANTNKPILKIKQKHKKAIIFRKKTQFKREKQSEFDNETE